MSDNLVSRALASWEAATLDQYAHLMLAVIVAGWLMSRYWSD